MLLKARIEEGCEITNTIAEAIALCQVVNVLPSPGMLDNIGRTNTFYDLEITPDESDQCTVRFVFEGVTVSVQAASNPELIYRDWNRAQNGYIEKTVGPHPKSELSNEELPNDARIRRWAHRERVEARMANAPAMEFSDKSAWHEIVAANGSNPLGDSMLAFAVRWARMMQLELSEGRTLEEIWVRTSQEADVEGMSGASSSFATHLLTLCWVHGTELRRLYNAYWGSDDTVDTVDPSIIYYGNE